MTPDRIVVTRRPPGTAVERLSNYAETWVWPEDRAIEPSILAQQAATATGLYTMLTDRIDADLLDQAPHLRVVSQMAVGVNNIDLAACAARNIVVGHTPDVLTESVADLAIGLIIAAARRFGEGHDDVTEGRWGVWQPDYLLGLDVHHSTIGIVGFGRIGQAVAKRAKGFSMRVLYTQRNANLAAAAQYDAEYRTLPELLAESDHVVVATPLSAETHHLISDRELKAMKQTGTLVNIGRGPLVDTDALVDALVNNEIFAAALDVTQPEPIAHDHRLVNLPNCYILPHIGSSTFETRIAMADLAAENLIAGLQGTPLPARAGE